MTEAAEAIGKKEKHEALCAPRFALHLRSVIRRHPQFLWRFIAAETIDVELRAAAGTPKYVHRQRVALNEAHKDIALAVGQRADGTSALRSVMVTPRTTWQVRRSQYAGPTGPEPAPSTGYHRRRR